MKIHMFGTPDEIYAVTDILAEVLDMAEVSEPAAYGKAGRVRVNLDADLRDSGLPMMVAPPKLPPVTMQGGKPATAAEIRPTDRLLTDKGWHRVVRVVPEEVTESTEAVFVYTRKDEPPFLWSFPPDAPLRRMKLLSGGDPEELFGEAAHDARLRPLVVCYDELQGLLTGERPAMPGELCTCGRPAVKVFLGGPYGDTGYCGLPDGGLRGPCPFCGEARHESTRCPRYTLRPSDGSQ